MQHPYTDLPKAAFWRSAVADVDPGAMHGIYQPKFPLRLSDRVATAGSCFAQHLGRALREAGLNLLDCEPPPARISSDLAGRYGYHMYSGRYGNIYTVRQMVQLLDEVAGGTPDPAHVWTRDGRFFDALRPNVEPGGMASADEVLDARRRHLARLAAMLAEASIFVFTLGLTEAWRCRATGRVYPLAPGVVAGEYDPDLHEFVNFTHADVMADLDRLRAGLQRIAPGLRMILTVSPVPLTATASGGHVLMATARSKARLRAAAGDFADLHADVDYFPSYEIVTNPAARGAYFAADLRQVTRQGVLAVMMVFLRAHRLGRHVSLAESVPQHALQQAVDEVVCEEILLESLRK